MRSEKGRVGAAGREVGGAGAAGVLSQGERARAAGGVLGEWAHKGFSATRVEGIRLGRQVAGGYLAGVRNQWSRARTSGEQLGGYVVRGTGVSREPMRRIGRTLATVAINAVRTMHQRAGEAGIGIGAAISRGMAEGIHAGIPAIRRVAERAAAEALYAARARLRARSPSQEFMTIGRSIGHGMALGIRSSTGAAVSAARAMAGAVMAAGRPRGRWYLDERPGADRLTRRNTGMPVAPHVARQWMREGIAVEGARRGSGSSTDFLRDVVRRMATSDRYGISHGIEAVRDRFRGREAERDAANLLKRMWSGHLAGLGSSLAHRRRIQERFEDEIDRRLPRERSGRSGGLSSGLRNLGNLLRAPTVRDLPRLVANARGAYIGNLLQGVRSRPGDFSVAAIAQAIRGGLAEGQWAGARRQAVRQLREMFARWPQAARYVSGSFNTEWARSSPTVRAPSRTRLSHTADRDGGLTINGPLWQSGPVTVRSEADIRRIEQMLYRARANVARAQGSRVPAR